MKRNDFLKLMAGVTILGSWIMSCVKKDRTIPGRIVGASSSRGHLLRDKTFGEPVSVTRVDTVIVGAGVSGLSSARHLHQQGHNNFVVLDLEDHAGGNASHGANAVSAFPWGAHYIPLPNNNLHEYLAFLEASQVITGHDAGGLPVYNESFLCFDPEERLYINGRWQDGLIPDFGLGADDSTEIRRFLAIMHTYRTAKGSDGRYAFAIPVDESSLDNIYTSLDTMTMLDWLTSNGFKGTYLHEYVNYCTRDDFGTLLKDCSAWAGIHYFASRKGIGANASHSDVLTWPEGNGFLINQLKRGIEEKIQCNRLVVSVKPDGQLVNVDYLETDGAVHRIQATQCILSTPQFVNGRLLNDEDRKTEVAGHYSYMSWMVANLAVGPLVERSGAGMSWDNVIHGSASLGYVEATHQLLRMDQKKKNLTYYLPLLESDVQGDRKAAQQRTFSDWVGIITKDLEKIHPGITDAIEEINLMIWGHAMVQTRPGHLFGGVRKRLASSGHPRIHLAHTDLAGISIFEEGFYQGLAAAKKILAV